jgi:predicted esterase
MNRTTDRWRAAADKAGAILLTPQGTVGMGDGEFHWGGDLDTVERNVMKAIDEVMDQYKVDTSKIVIGGFSQGGWAAWSLGARNPDTFCGIIPVCGSVNDDDAKRLAQDDCKNLRVWVMLGEDENSRVLDANEDAAKTLRKTGAKVTVKTYEGVAHGFPDNSDEELTNALRFIFE